MPTIFDQIVADVRKRQFADAHDLIKEALQVKVEAALAEEKKSLSESDDDPAGAKHV